MRVTASRAATGMTLSARMLLAGPFASQLAYYDRFWRERSRGRDARRVNVPTFVTGGWDDLLVRGEPRVYRALRSPRSYARFS